MIIYILLLFTLICRPEKKTTTKTQNNNLWICYDTFFLLNADNYAISFKTIYIGFSQFNHLKYGLNRHTMVNFIQYFDYMADYNGIGIINKEFARIWLPVKTKQK